MGSSACAAPPGESKGTGSPHSSQRPFVRPCFDTLSHSSRPALDLARGLSFLASTLTFAIEPRRVWSRALLSELSGLASDRVVEWAMLMGTDATAGAQ